MLQPYCPFFEPWTFFLGQWSAPELPLSHYFWPEWPKSQWRDTTTVLREKFKKSEIFSLCRKFRFRKNHVRQVFVGPEWNEDVLCRLLDKILLLMTFVRGSLWNSLPVSGSGGLMKAHYQEGQSWGGQAVQAQKEITVLLQNVASRNVNVTYRNCY